MAKAWLEPSGKAMRVDKPKMCFQIVWRDKDGKKRKQTTGTKKLQEAKAILKKFNDQYEEQQKSGYSPTLMSDAMKESFDELHITPDTRNRYENLIKDFLIYAGTIENDYLYSDKRSVRDILLDDISLDMINGFKRWCAEPVNVKKRDGAVLTECRYSDKMIQMIIARIKAVLVYAVKKGYVKENFVDDIKNIPQGKVRQKPIRAFNKPELEIIFESEIHANIVDCYRGLLHLGCRLGELCALSWEHVDFDAGNVRIYGEKTNKWRTVPISKALRPHIDKMHKNKKPGQSHVFSMETGVRANKHLYDILAKICTTNGFNDVVTHSFRHTFIQNHLRAGADFKTIMKWTGHTDIKTFMVYLEQYLPTNEDIDIVTQESKMPWLAGL